MGYFNYFIKCIIRNIAYRLCKPKVLLTILLAVVILFVLHSTGYCALDDTDYEMIADGFATITSNQGTMISQLSSMGVNVTDIENELIEINNMLSGISSTTENISSKLTSIYNKIETLNTNILNIYNTLETNQQELIQELEQNNQEVLEELQTLRAVLAGDSTQSTGIKLNSFSYFNSSPLWSDYNSVTTSITSGNLFGVNTFNYTFKAGYTYTFTYIPTTTTTGSSYVGYTFDEVSVGSSVLVYNLGNINRLSNSFTIKFNDDTNLTLLFRNPVDFSNAYGSWKIEGEINGSINNLNNSINQGNQLQQEQNQLQQEQNDILTDDNVNTDGLEFATDDTVNPTTDGFNTLFNTVYNAFCNTSSEPLTITLPYINETFTIQPNIVSNGMQKAGLGVIVSLINSFYYFSVCLFIYKDIAKIIDNLKSGNITADCGNVKTEVL